MKKSSSSHKKTAAKKSTTSRAKNSARKITRPSGKKSKATSKVAKKKAAGKTAEKTEKKTSKKPSKAAPALGRSSLGSVLKNSVKNVSDQFRNIFSSRPRDIAAAVEADHEALRNFIGLLKDTKQNMTERRRAYRSFADLLKSHTVAEENAVYKMVIGLPGHELKLKITEGFAEHKVAEGLLGKVNKAKKAVEWSARANVLAEIVEHHLKEEERDLLPLIRKTAPAQLKKQMLEKFIALRSETQKSVTKKSAGVLKPA
jgi:hemerythrin-like domain-containing protein